MSDGRKVLVCLCSSLLLSWGAYAIVADSANPYQGIVDRNVFGLKPPPAPTKGTENETPPPVKITLTGVITILGKKQALITVPVPPKPGEPAKPPQSFILAIGEREAGIEVLDIDEKTAGGTVKFNNNGVIESKNMEKDAPKLTASAAPPGPGGVPSPGYVPPPAFPSGNISVPTATGMKSIPTRTLRTPGMMPGSAPGAAVTPGAMLTPGAMATPGIGFAQNPGATATPAPVTPPVINEDQQAMNMLAQHLQHTDQGIPMPPLPPPLAEILEQPGSQQATPAPGNTGTITPTLPRAPGLPLTPPAPRP